MQPPSLPLFHAWQGNWRQGKQKTARFLSYAARPGRSLCKMQILSNKHWSIQMTQKKPLLVSWNSWEKVQLNLVGLIMHIMIKHFQTGRWFWEAPLQNEHPFFQIKDTRSICKIGPRLVGSTGHQILKIKNLMLVSVYTKSPSFIQMIKDLCVLN